MGEGAAAVGVSLLLRGRTDLQGRRTAVVISGRNVDMAIFTRLMNEEPTGDA